MQIDDQIILRFNLFRENMLGKELKRNEMKKELKSKMGFPASDQFLKCITDGINPPVIKVKRGIYAVNPKPVFKERLQTVFDEYKNTIKSKTAHNKKSISIEEAILVLKNAGYRVMKPETKWIEIT
jgi:hypothetical protein